MKNTAYILALLMGGATLTACDDDHKPDWEITAPFDVKAESVSIENGATVALSTEKIEIVYNTAVVLNPRAEITMTGDALKGVEIVDGNRLVVEISLSKGKTYTLTIPANAVAGIGSKTFAPAMELTFSTEKGGGVITDASKVAASPINAAATAEAKALYTFLRENYGKKQLSGVMGEVAWATTFSDMVAAEAGKYPAIVGFDYIHLAYSPSNWIDYGDISPVKGAWDAGSIPAMTWHWNVPVSEDGGDGSFNASSDQFKASNVLVEGTWENRVATADVEKLAGYLKLLQDAGIPVLWRPFHEAAGDYTWGAWFWWGNSGTEVTKELWSWLHTKLTDEYGLNNLIWVWTVQTSDEGKPASMDKIRAAYPGDALVDIVGVDLYEAPLSDCTGQFELLYNLVEGKKMVALSECGNLLDVDAALEAGALWSYFMGWYEMENGLPVFNQWNTAGEWKSILNNPAVINRGDFNLMK